MLNSSLGRVWFLRLAPYAVCVYQFCSLWYNPTRQIPTEEDGVAGMALVQMVSEIEGEVFIPHHGYMAARVGKKAYVHTVGINDILRSRDDLAPSLKAKLQQAIREKRFAAIVSNGDNWLQETVQILDSHYTDKGPIFNSPDVFYPVTGVHTRPEHFWVPR